MNTVIRQARKEEASQIAELFMLAWPVDEILESNGLTREQLHESITLVAASEQTIYSYENTLEEMVVYQAMYGERGIWVRPKTMFNEVIERDGKTFRRFSPISAEEAENIINNL